MTTKRKPRSRLPSTTPAPWIGGRVIRADPPRVPREGGQRIVRLVLDINLLETATVPAVQSGDMISVRLQAAGIEAY